MLRGPTGLIFRLQGPPKIIMEKCSLREIKQRLKSAHEFSKHFFLHKSKEIISKIQPKAYKREGQAKPCYSTD